MMTDLFGVLASVIVEFLVGGLFKALGGFFADLFGLPAETA